jgi:hypothetical protein
MEDGMAGKKMDTMDYGLLLVGGGVSTELTLLVIRTGVHPFLVAVIGLLVLLLGRIAGPRQDMLITGVGAAASVMALAVVKHFTIANVPLEIWGLVLIMIGGVLVNLKRSA